MLVAQQHLIREPHTVQVDQCNLASVLAYQVVTGCFGSKRVIKLNAVDVIARVQAIHQNDILLANAQREPRANNQYVITQPTA
ncbi:hypothetical protein D3C73_1369340 [compost metagenome]